MVTSRTRDIIALVASVALPLGLGAVGGVVTADAIPDWYAGLAKPAWNPPNWLFGPVWTVLYASMGVAAWLVWRRGRDTESPAAPSLVRSALTVYAAQLALNAIWSPVFFGLKRLDIAFVIIVAMLVLIAETMRRFHRVRPVAALLLAPYLAWVTFATLLNWSVWRLNGG